MRIARDIGRTRALRLVVDSLKLLPSNPSFLDGRDAMILALEHDHAAQGINAEQYSSELVALWANFARAGMGKNASCQGATLQNVSADFSVPASAVGPARQPWVRSGPAGTVPLQAALAAVSPRPDQVDLYVALATILVSALPSGGLGAVVWFPTEWR